jgi:hypothetical protein
VLGSHGDKDRIAIADRILNVIYNHLSFPTFKAEELVVLGMSLHTNALIWGQAHENELHRAAGVEDAPKVGIVSSFLF